jgi:hypothetical protein
MVPHRAWLFALALCVLAGLCIALTWHRPVLLWPGAYPIEATQGWFVTDTIASGYDYVPRRASAWFWRSGSEVTTLRYGTDGALEWIDFNLASQHKTRRQQGSMLEPFPSTAELFYWSASPDGRWLLQLTRNGQRDRMYSTFTMEGKFHLAWTNRYESHTHPEWLSDSSGFVEWPIREGQLLARVHWLETGTMLEIQIDQLPGITNSSATPLPQPFVPLTKWPVAPGAAAEFLILQPTDDPASWHRRTLLVPEALIDFIQVQVYPAPTGDRLAWLAHATSRVPMVKASHDFPFLKFQPKHSTTLFLSQSDGSDLRRIGRTRHGEILGHLQWTPDARRLSFIYDETLWVQSLPVP